MLKVLFDEDFRGSIYQGLQRRRPDFDVLRVQDSEVTGCHDSEVLQFAAREGRVVISHDGASMPDYAYARVESGLECWASG